jgi:hypothetical protein
VLGDGSQGAAGLPRHPPNAQQLPPRPARALVTFITIVISMNGAAVVNIPPSPTNVSSLFHFSSMSNTILLPLCRYMLWQYIINMLGESIQHQPSLDDDDVL